MWSKSAGAIFLLFRSLFQTLPGFAQDDLRRNNDPIIIPEGQTEVKYPRVEEMPRQLQKALYRRCGRDQLDWLKGIPARIIKPKPGELVTAASSIERFLQLPRHFLNTRIFHFRLALGNDDGIVVPTKVILRKSRKGLKERSEE